MGRVRKVEEARLAVVNPNASESITRRIARRLDEMPPPVAWRCITNVQAPPTIESEADLEQCTAGLLASLEGQGYAAAVIAGFVDPGVDLLRARLGIPVVGLGSAALYAASCYGSFGILSVHRDLEPLLLRFVEESGYRRVFTGVKSLESSVLSASDGEVDAALLAHRFRDLARAGASAICLGSGSLAHLSLEWQSLSPVPLIDGLGQAAAFGAALIRAHGKPP